MKRGRGLADFEEGLRELRPASPSAEAKAEPARYCPHDPTPKQREFLALDCPEALYGGAAGSGKSDVLLMAALQYVHVPGYSALLLRRTFSDLALPGAIMDRANTWLSGTDARWNSTDRRWTFPSGASWTFGYLDNDADRFRYQSAEFQFVGFDELTQFPEKWYLYLHSRLRRLAGSTVPIRMRAATNPGGVGHEWVKRRFVTGPVPFVPALLADNPHIDAVSYREQLAKLDAETRDQLERGIWRRNASGLVYSYDAERNRAVLVPDKSWSFVLGIDYGVVNACAFCELGWRPYDPITYVTRVHKAQDMSPSSAAEFVRAWDSVRRYERMVGDSGGLGKGFIKEAVERFGLPIEPAEKNNKRGYIALFNGELEGGRVKLLPEAEPLAAEYADLPWNKARTAEEEGFENHAADGTLYGWREAFAYRAEPEPPPPPLPGSAEASKLEEAAAVAEFDRRRRDAERRGRSHPALRRY